MSLTHQEELWLLEKHAGEQSPEFFADVARLESGEPLAFVLGHIPFLNTTIYLDSHPLIPRVETEYWVGKATEHIKASGITSPRVLDLCSGSGCIGVALAQELPLSTVHFAELDDTHHATIRKNIAENGIADSRTRIVGGHLFAHTEPPYDFILSNPPYIQNGSEHVAESVKNFEPSLALYGGEDGLDLITEILNASKQYLTPQGVLFIEHDPEQSAAIRERATESGLTCATHTDQYEVARYSTFTVAQY